MTHVFVAPHPDDVALSCGGLIASLRELGQNVAIVTVFSGSGATDGLTPYQREALGLRLEDALAGHGGVQPERTWRRITRATTAPSRRGRPSRIASMRPRQTRMRRRSGSGSDLRGTAARCIHNLPLAGQLLVDDVSRPRARY